MLQPVTALLIPPDQITKVLTIVCKITTSNPRLNPVALGICQSDCLANSCHKHTTPKIILLVQDSIPSDPPNQPGYKGVVPRSGKVFLFFRVLSWISWQKFTTPTRLAHKLSHTLTLWVSLIPQPSQQPLHTDVFIQGIPVNTMNTQLKSFTACTISTQQTGKPNQRRTNRSAIGQQNPKVILIKPDFLRRNSHATHPPKASDLPAPLLTVPEYRKRT